MAHGLVHGKSFSVTKGPLPIEISAKLGIGLRSW